MEPLTARLDTLPSAPGFHAVASPLTASNAAI
jgi:hypothetical protein